MALIPVSPYQYIWHQFEFRSRSWSTQGPCVPNDPFEVSRSLSFSYCPLRGGSSVVVYLLPVVGVSFCDVSPYMCIFCSVQVAEWLG